MVKSTGDSVEFPGAVGDGIDVFFEPAGTSNCADSAQFSWHVCFYCGTERTSEHQRCKYRFALFDSTDFGVCGDITWNTDVDDLDFDLNGFFRDGSNT